MLARPEAVRPELVHASAVAAATAAAPIAGASGGRMLPARVPDGANGLLDLTSGWLAVAVVDAPAGAARESAAAVAAAAGAGLMDAARAKGLGRMDGVRGTAGASLGTAKEPVELAVAAGAVPLAGGGRLPDVLCCMSRRDRGTTEQGAVRDNGARLGLRNLLK